MYGDIYSKGMRPVEPKKRKMGKAKFSHFNGSDPTVQQASSNEEREQRQQTMDENERLHRIQELLKLKQKK